MFNPNDLQNEPLIRDAISLIGPLPSIAGSSSVPAAVQPRAVAKEVIGFDLDLDRADRAAVIDALTRAFPVEVDPATRKPVLKQARAGEPLAVKRGAVPVVGKMAVAAVALRTLAEHARHLDDLAALKSCDGDACGPEALIAVIRQCIRELVQYFEAGYPNAHAVDSALRTLCGFDLAGKGFPADPDALGGTLGELKARCRFDPAAACGIEGETSITNFDTLVALTAIFANAWLEARADGCPSPYFAVNVQEVHHHLTAVVLTLDRLRALVPAEDWVTTEVPVEPPITAATMWELMHHYCRSGALEMLRHGREGTRAVLDKMVTFEELATAMTRRKAGRGLRAFSTDKVQERLRDLLYHVQKVREALA